MKVKVIARGFLYWIRHPGEMIEVADHLYSADWMEKVPPTADAPAPPPTEFIEIPVDLKAAEPQKVGAATTLDVK